MAAAREACALHVGDILLRLAFLMRFVRPKLSGEKQVSISLSAAQKRPDAYLPKQD